MHNFACTCDLRIHNLSVKQCFAQAECLSSHNIWLTVFPRIDSAETILFWKLKCGNYSKGETIQGRKLLISCFFISLHYLNSIFDFALFKINSLKFIYSEKATKFCKIFTLLLYYVVPTYFIWYADMYILMIESFWWKEENRK